jgi:hypothetical protein
MDNNPMSKYKRIHPAGVKTSKLTPFNMGHPRSNYKRICLAMSSLKLSVTFVSAIFEVCVCSTPNPSK